MMSLFLTAALLVSTNLHAQDVVAINEPVDLERYSGTWYEIAKLPNRFQKDCLDTKADYKLRPDGKVVVTNSLYSKKRPGKLIEAKGLAKSVDQTNNAKLKVTFTPWAGFLFSGDYWILALEQDYSHVLVGTPNKENLWILSRSPILGSEKIANLKGRAKKMGFDVEKMIVTPPWETAQ